MVSLVGGAFGTASVTTLRVYSNTDAYLVVLDGEVLSCSVLNAVLDCTPMGFSVLISGVIPSALTTLHLLVGYRDGSEHLVEVPVSHTASGVGTFFIQATCLQGTLSFPDVLISGEQPLASSDFFVAVNRSQTTASLDRFSCRCDIIGEEPISLIEYTEDPIKRFSFSQVPSSEYGTIDLLLDSAVVWRFNVLFGQ